MCLFLVAVGEAWVPPCGVSDSGALQDVRLAVDLGDKVGQWEPQSALANRNCPKKF